MAVNARNQEASVKSSLRSEFRYESGHHGKLWLEIPQLYLRPSRLRRLAAELVRELAAHGVEAGCGPLVEGALLSFPQQTQQKEFHPAYHLTDDQRQAVDAQGRAAS